jgi:hypothetical protein
VQQLLAQDNATRQAAEGVYEQLKKHPDGCLDLLLRCLRTSQAVENRQFCAIMMRKVGARARTCVAARSNQTQGLSASAAATTLCQWRVRVVPLCAQHVCGVGVQRHCVFRVLVCTPSAHAPVAMQHTHARSAPPPHPPTHTHAHMPTHVRAGHIAGRAHTVERGLAAGQGAAGSGVVCLAAGMQLGR